MGAERGRGANQQFGGGGGPQRSYSAMNRGDRIPNLPNVRPMSESDFQNMERAYREGLGDLRNLRQSVRQDDPEMAREIQSLIREMQALDPSRFPGNPALVNRLTTEVLPNLEQIELRLRRQLEEAEGGQVRGGLTLPVPAGYADAVAEYFRKLSEGK
ncbi:MAG: hypothetical protein GY953_32455 [bacterium]|nr:hypothetical protein [bacterium]